MEEVKRVPSGGSSFRGVLREHGSDPTLEDLLLVPLYLLVILLPLEHVLIGPTSVTRLGVVVVLCSAVLLTFFRFAFPTPERRPGTFLLYTALPFLLGLVIVLSALHNAGTTDGGLRWRTVFSGMTQPLAALAVFVLLRYRAEAVGRIAWLFVAIGVGLGLVNLAQAAGILPLVGDVGPGRRNLQLLASSRYSPIPIFGTYGVLSSIALGFLLGRLQAATRGGVLRSAAFIGSVTVIFLGVLLTQSRSTYLALASVLTVYLLLSKRGASRLVLIGTMALIGGLVLIPIVDFLIAVNPRTVLNRISTFRLALDAFRGSPILGIGWDIRAITNEQDRVIHNTFVALLGYLGLVGFAVHMTCYAGVAWLAHRDWRNAGSDAWIHMGILLGAVGWFVENMFYLGIRGYAIWVLLGMAIHLSTSRHSSASVGADRTTGSLGSEPRRDGGGGPSESLTPSVPSG